MNLELETVKLPEGKPGNPAVLDATAEFATKVAESKQNIAAENATPKRGRGRPRKVVPVTAAPQQSMHSEPSVVQGPPPPDISQHLTTPLIAISKIPAAKYGVPEIALTPDEAALCAKSLNDMLNAFVPDVGQMSPKTAATIGFFTTVGSIAFSKYAIYATKAPATIEAPPASPPTPGASPFPTQTALEAGEYFKSPKAG